MLTPTADARSGSEDVPSESYLYNPSGDTAKKASRSWWESRSARVILIATILLLVGLVARIYLPREATQIYLRGLILVSDALLVIAVTVLLTEAGPFRSYIEERLGALKDKIDEPVFRRLTDVAFLRSTFSYQYLLSLRKAATVASMPKGICKYPDLLAAIDQRMLPCAAQPLCRRNHDVTLTHELVVRGSHTYLKQKATHTFEYVNLSDSPIVKDIRISVEAKVMPDVSEGELVSGAWAAVQQSGADTAVPQVLNLTQTRKGDSVIFEGCVPVTVAREPVTVQLSRRSIIPVDDVFVLTFYDPTVGLQITYCFGSA